MSLEREIKKAFERHAGDVEPDARAFGGIETRVRRSHQRRLVATTTIALVLIAAGAVVVPQFLRGDRDPGFFEPGPDPTATPAPEGLVTVRDEQDGWQLLMPEDWRVVEFEGAVELLPPGMIATAAGEDTFAVELMLFHGEPFTDAPNATLGGRDATVTVEGMHRIYRGNWSGSVCDPCTLQVTFFASTEELRDRYAEDAEDIRIGLRHIDAPDMFVGEIRTRRGVVWPAVQYDETTAVLVRFLEARMRGDEAERWMSPTAAEAAADRLYGDLSGAPWLAFTVTERSEIDGGVAFQVDLIVQIGENGPHGDTERIVVDADAGVVSSVGFLGDFPA